MPISESDPRVFFAAERTLLAWLRTGLTIVVIGFVVARFGLFVRLLSLQLHLSPISGSSPLSAILGIIFVVVGSIAILIASIQHHRFVATLSPPDLPPAYSRSMAVALSLLVAMLGLMLSGYLWVTSS